jgi:Type I phosphodiesterase / nucleotide pyrophosphatase
LIVPRYDDGGFAALPGTVARLLGAGDGGVALDGAPARAERVVLVLLDAFGWRFFTRHGDHPLLQRVDAVARLTSQFPSTTTAHITTLHAGVPVGSHGLYEWNVYEPSLGEVITPLLFSPAGELSPDRLSADPDAVLACGRTMYEQLGARGVECHVFGPAAFTPSTYDGVLTRGAHAHAMDGLDAGLAELAATLRAATGPAYAYLYWDQVDYLGHRYGPSSPEFDAAAVRALDALDAGLCALPDGTVVLLAADHGQIDVDPATTIFVNEAWPELPGLLAQGSSGRALAPAGAARDLFLHCRPETVDEIVEGLERVVDDRATVRRVTDLVAGGWFGEAGDRLRARLADVCVLPAPGETVWWRERDRFDMRFRGHHGGLSEEEAETQVAAFVV